LERARLRGRRGPRDTLPSLPSPLPLPLLGFLSALVLVSSCAEPRALPDVVLITVDTLRADHLGAYGYPDASTPHLDELAGEGRVFHQAVTPFPRTTPAIASLLTALSPTRHGSREVGNPLRTSIPLLPEILSTHGWVSVGVSSNLAAGSRQGLDRGFDRFVDRDALQDHRAARVTDRALELVRGVPASRPVFLWAHYSDPHFPYDPPESFSDAGGAAECRALQARLEARRIPRGSLVSNWDGSARRALADCVELYDAEIAYTDHEVGRLLAGLRREGRLVRFILVFTSDHGENLGEADLYYEHGPSVHDASLRVPLIFAGDGVVAGGDANLARLEDVAPTVLDWVGIPPDSWGDVDGRSLAKRLRGGVDPDAPEVTFAEAGRAFHRQDFHRLFSGSAKRRCLNGQRFSLCRLEKGDYGLYDPHADPALTQDLSETHRLARNRLLLAWAFWQGRDASERTARTSRFKLVERPTISGWNRLLYDLDRDPGEEQDVSADHPEITRRLAQALEDWAAPLERPARLGAGEMELLRQLGYAE
jgi:arylsulfatase A-like enzyme